MDLLEPTAYRVVICTVARVPLLGTPRLARIAAEAWQCISPAPEAFETRPTQIRATFQTGDLAAVDCAVRAYKQHSETCIAASLLRIASDDLLNAVRYYNPVWPGVIYRVWENGYHRQPLFSDNF